MAREIAGNKKARGSAEVTLRFRKDKDGNVQFYSPVKRRWVVVPESAKKSEDVCMIEPKGRAFVHARADAFGFIDVFVYKYPKHCIMKFTMLFDDNAVIEFDPWDFIRTI